jgi:hypothetical protein
VALFVVGFLALLAYSTLHGQRYRVEVCMTFDGRSACRTVNAKSEAAAVRSATENACADISSGVDDTIRCQNTEPKSVRWLNR